MFIEPTTPREDSDLSEKSGVELLALWEERMELAKETGGILHANYELERPETTSAVTRY